MIREWLKQPGTKKDQYKETRTERKGERKEKGEIAGAKLYKKKGEK